MHAILQMFSVRKVQIDRYPGTEKIIITELKKRFYSIEENVIQVWEKGDLYKEDTFHSVCSCMTFIDKHFISLTAIQITSCYSLYFIDMTYC